MLWLRSQFEQGVSYEQGGRGLHCLCKHGLVQPSTLHQGCSACSLLRTPCCCNLRRHASDGKGMRHLNCVFAGEGMKPLSEGQASDEVRWLLFPMTPLCCLVAGARLPRLLALRLLPTSKDGIDQHWCFQLTCVFLLPLQGSYRNVQMNGQEVFKFAVRAVPTVRGRRLQGAAHWCGRQQHGICAR
jgi:hypothetical protein